MKQAALISLLITLLFLSPTIITILPTSASAQMYQSASVVDYGPTTAVVNQATTLFVVVAEGGSPAQASVNFYLEGSPVTYISTGGQVGPVSTVVDGVASMSFTFTKAGTFTFTAYVTTSSGGTTSKSWTCTVTGGNNPTPVVTPRVTPVVTPVVTPRVTPVPGPIVIFVPAPTDIQNKFPPGSTITQGTGPYGPRTTVTQPPTATDEITTIIMDWASDIYHRGSIFDNQTALAHANGYQETARGGSASTNDRYVKFAKGGSTLLIAEQGNNTTNKYVDVPGEVVITQQTEARSSATDSSIFGLSNFALYAIIAGIVILALIITLTLYQRTRKEEPESEWETDQQQFYPPR